MKSTEKRRGRRENGEGSIDQLPSGRYRARVLMDDGRYKAFTSWHRDIVVERMRGALDQQRHGRLVMESTTPLLEYLTWWLEDIHAPCVRYRRVESLRYAFRQVRPPLALVQLRRLKLQHFEDFATAQLRSGRAPVSIRKDLQGISQALDYAVKRDLINMNPTRYVTRPKGGSAEKACLTPEQAKHLLMSTVGQPDHALWALLLSTGARISEALALYWSDIDLDAGLVTIAHSLEVRHDPETGASYRRMDPKTDAGKRCVDIDQDVVNALRSWRHMQAEMRLKTKHEWLNPDLVFPTKTGRPRHRCVVAKCLHEALAAARLPQVGCHGLRHTSASLAIMRGVDILVVSRRLGHKSPTITRDIYQHVMPGQQKEAAAIIGEALWGRST